jgi:4-amino-4-deoxy-L-arabinose transferase-like glycosyltransferase
MNRSHQLGGERLYIVGLTLLAFAVRIVALEGVPPGWRDDELINIHALSAKLLDGQFLLYFTDASGHEPLYHWLQAGMNAIGGYNVLSGHLLSVLLGTLSIPLNYVLVRRLFEKRVAALASLGLALSFWSLMYSRIGLRHINLPPVALTVFYLIWYPLDGRRGPTRWWPLFLGCALATSLYVYPAARLLPAVLVAFGLYLALFQRKRFRRVRNGYALALVVAALLALPLFLAIRQGSNVAAAQGIGADARLVELARPLRALQEGDPAPLLDSAWRTLGMFHATGDPEWLYNIPGRPVFNLLGGLFFWAGVLISLYRWRQPRYGLVCLWLGAGLLPTVLSVPPASLSHSILVQPLAYLFPVLALAPSPRRTGQALSPRTPRRDVAPQSSATRRAVRSDVTGLAQGQRWLASCTTAAQQKGWRAKAPSFGFWTLAVLFLLSNGLRDLRDYFIRWPELDMVGFLYRADYRQAARFLDNHPEIADVTVGSTLLGPWDRLALRDDLQRQDVSVRLFDPQRALLVPGDGVSDGTGERKTVILVTRFPPVSQTVEKWLDAPPTWQGQSLSSYSFSGELPASTSDLPAPVLFANGLELSAVEWPKGRPEPGQEVALWLTWRLVQPLNLPPIPIVANPPPPGEYNGPRLAVFTHLLDGTGVLIAGDDGLWVDPTTLQPGDRFVQVHRLAVPPETPLEPLALELGLYDPLTNERWLILNGAGQPAGDRLLLDVDQP